MKQKLLMKISFLISLLGIALMLLLIQILEPELIGIEKINNKMLEKSVKIQGIVSKIEDKQTFKILSVNDGTGNIDVLCKCNNKKIKENQKIIVKGKVQEYKEKLQSLADKIISYSPQKEE